VPDVREDGDMPMTFKLDDEFKARNRPHTRQERIDLTELIKAEGCIEDALTVAIIDDGEHILCDGYTTHGICEELSISIPKPRYINLPSRDAVLAWIDKRQKGRRNLTAEEMAEDRSKRIPRVVEAKANGQSTREIAAIEGVSQKTIVEDLHKASKEGFAVQSDTRVSGKSADRTITEESPVENGEILCSKCSRLKRTGQKVPKSCKECKAARDAEKIKVDVNEEQVEEDESEPTVEDIMKEKNGQIESFARKLQAMIEDMPTDPWLDKDNRKGGIAQKIKDACSSLRSCKCSNVCPMCKGEGCRQCEKTGRVPKYTYQQLVG
jgi:hypothetical protein